MVLRRALAKSLPRPKDWEYVEVRESRLHGRGLFAARRLPKGTHIMEYRGEKVNKTQGLKRTLAQWKEGRIYVFQLNSRNDVDGSPDWNIARLANSSCDPNAQSEIEDKKVIWIVATRNIPKGKEITYDYNLDFDDPPQECKCGSPKCIGYIVGTHERRKLRAWLKKHGKPIPKGLRPKKRVAAKKKAR